MTGPSEMERAALLVLGGRSLAEVAAELDVEEELVARWTDLFVEGGRLRLAGRLDPSSFEGRDRFLVLIAHEFRTPLTIIRGWAETILSGELSRETAYEGMQVIVNQLALLERTARDAIDAGAVAQGRLRLVLGPVRLRNLIMSVLSSMPNGAVTLAPGPEVELVADASRLEQIVGEVVAHSQRLAAGNAVTVTVDADHQDRVIVTLAVQGRELTFDEASELFEPFGRSDTSIGAGLGLWVCRALLSAHGGEIGLRSAGERTEFWFRMPRAGPEPSPLAAEA